ncbi:MAG: nucleoside deaminase [bacterium]
MNDDERCMWYALEEARKALAEDEVPVGAVLVNEQGLIAGGYNQVEGSNDPTAHAEMQAIRRASRHLGRWRLTGTTLYVTVEPCCMCLGAIILARIERLVFGIPEPKTGCCISQADLPSGIFSRYGLVVASGILADEARALMQTFFKKKRRGTEVRP